MRYIMAHCKGVRVLQHKGKTEFETQPPTTPTTHTQRQRDKEREGRGSGKERWVER